MMSPEYPLKYKYLSGMSDIRKSEHVTEPLHVSMTQEPWEQLNDKAYAYWRCTEDSFNLMSGTVNLINYIEQRYKEGSPVTTLLFMDKSARPAWYIYNQAGALAKKCFGAIGAEIASHKPRVCFINVGRESSEKFSDDVALAQVSTVFQKKDFTHEGTLIVDEFISTGKSIQKTQFVLGLAGFSSLVPGIGMFNVSPDWHGHTCVGIGEGVLAWTTRLLIREQYKKNPERVNRVTELLHTYGWRNMKDILMYDPNLEQTHPVPHTDLVTIQSFCQDTAGIVQTVQYLSSAGGFLGLSPSNHQRQETLLYREKLKNIVLETFRRKLITV